MSWRNSSCFAREITGDALEEQVGEPDDRIQRGAQLVAHAGEERALGPVRPLGVLLGLATGRLGQFVLREIDGCTLEAVEQGRVVERDCRLRGQGFEEACPLWARGERGAVEDLQHTLHLPLGNERHAPGGDEVLAREQRRADRGAPRVRQIRNAQSAAFERGTPGKVLPHPESSGLNKRRAKPPSSGIFQHLRVGVKEQHDRRVDPQVGDDLIENDVEGEAQVEA